MSLSKVYEGWGEEGGGGTKLKRQEKYLEYAGPQKKVCVFFPP